MLLEIQSGDNRTMFPSQELFSLCICQHKTAFQPTVTEVSIINSVLALMPYSHHLGLSAHYMNILHFFCSKDLLM